MVVEPLIVALLLAAALMHATWNAILKADQSDRLATFGLIMTTGTVMGLCIVPFVPLVEPEAWKFLILSVAIHIAYYFFLLKAYTYGDLSHTYPIARGLGPLLVALVSGRVIGEHLRTQDIVGVFLLSFGLVALALPLKNIVPKPGSRHGLATLFAVLTGLSPETAESLGDTVLVDGPLAVTTLMMMTTASMMRYGTTAWKMRSSVCSSSTPPPTPPKTPTGSSSHRRSPWPRRSLSWARVAPR